MVALTSQIALIVAALIAVVTASQQRIARQASQCKRGSKCVPLSSCPALEALLRSPNTKDLIRLREALCDSSRNNPKVCCEPQLTFATEPPVTSSGGGKVGLLPERCGLSTSSRRIFRGSNVPLGSYPWMAVLGYRVSANRPLDWGCGGVLINDQYVLTAAHCVQPDLPLEEIRLGEHNLDTNPDCIAHSADPKAELCAPRHQAFKVASRSSITIHPNYNRRSPISDDIALIRLERKANINNFVNPICLPEGNASVRSFLGDREAVVAGWGRTEEGPKSRIMKRVEIPLVDLETCQPFYNNRLVPEQVCFGGVGQRDSCDGDSGGPVFQADTTGVKHYLIGLVSFGSRCGGNPAVYTKMASYRSWIIENMRP